MTPRRIDGCGLSFALEGQGDPPILLLGGHRTPMTAWRSVWPMLTARARVLAYDRAGTGASEAAREPQDGAAVLSALDGLLERVGLSGPYLLAAHSLGGLYASLMARTWPERVAGMVLIEAAHPGQAHRAPPPDGTMRRAWRRLTARGFMDDPHSEYAGVPATVGQIAAAGPFPAIPLRVVTGARRMPLVPRPAFEAHQRFQRDLASLSPLGKQVIARQSGHMPQVTEPDLVASVVNDLHREIRGTAPPAS